jgi:hypothetical protein
MRISQNQPKTAFVTVFIAFFCCFEIKHTSGYDDYPPHCPLSINPIAKNKNKLVLHAVSAVFQMSNCSKGPFMV